MTTSITYLFDPLCGWCYGASPVLQQLGQHPGVQLTLAPSGLFAGSGRTMDAAFAAYAWSNDQRIHKLTGQEFSETYRQQVLGRHGSTFDSTAATVALAAVALTDASAERGALKHLQVARYVRGLDTCDSAVVADLLRELGLDAAADRLLARDAALIKEAQSRVQGARQLMQSLGMQGVPALVITGEEKPRVLSSQLLYGPLEKLLSAAGVA